MNKKYGRKKKKRLKISRITFSVWLVFSLLFFQIYPVFLVVAQEVSLQEEKTEEISLVEKTEEKIEEFEAGTEEEEKPKVEESSGEIIEEKSEIDKKDICQEADFCPEISIEIENEAVIDNDVETVADSGENEFNGAVIEGETAEEEMDSMEERTVENTSVVTEEAVCEAVIINEANKNIVTENGNDLSLDIYGNYSGDIDLLTEFEKILEKAREKAEEENSVLDISVENVNEAEVKNEIETIADTGGNTVDPEQGDSQIQTGDAAAVSLLVNLINTNIVGDNWLFVTLNIFGSWAGNLIVPGEGVLETPAGRDFSDVEIVNENKAEIENNVETVAKSGGNTAVSENGSAEIQVGDAVAETSVKNVVNTNIVRNNWFFLLINNMGVWSGKLLGWDGEEKDILEYDFENESDENILAGSLTVHNQNEAYLENNVFSSANTGENSAVSGSGASAIATGGAFAFSKIFNLVNTNIIGDNWFFGVVNNMGIWEGDVEFAYPDLAVSITDGKDKAEFGEKLDYSIRVRNVGKAACAETRLAARAGGEERNWEISSLGAGEEQEFSFSLNAPDSSERLEAGVSVQTETEEKVLENNSAQDYTLLETKKNNLSGGASNGEEDKNKISISRSSTSAGDLRPGDRLKNSILLENSGEALVSGVILRDTMLGEDGQEAVFYEWPIGDMKEGAKIRVEYEMVVNNPGRSLSIAYEAQAYGESQEGEEVESRRVRDAFTVFGFILAAQAAGGEEILSPVYEDEVFPGQILGTEALAPERKLSIIFWILAAVSYALAINWAYFPMRKASLRRVV